MVWIVFEKPNSILSITTAKNTDPKGARGDALVLFTLTPYIYMSQLITNYVHLWKELLLIYL